jgi:hypothetical protein
MDFNTSLERDDDIIYYNLEATNNTNNFLKCNFDDIRTQSILGNASNYNVSVIKFSCTSFQTPLFFFQNNWNIGFKYNLFTFIRPVEFISAYSPPIVDNEFSNSIFYYNNFCDMVNVTFEKLFQDVLNVGAPVSTQPYLVYNPESQLFSIFVETAYYNTTPFDNVVGIYFNYPLYSKVPSFYNDLNTIQSDPLYRYHQILIYSNGLNKLIYGLTNVESYEVKQEYYCLDYMNDALKIVIASNTLPCSGENISNVFNSIPSDSSLSVKYISDYTITALKSGEQRGIIHYVPNIYRFVSLNSTCDIRNVNLQFFVYYQNFNGTYKNEYLPLKMAPFSSLNVKLMFKKKSLTY